MKSAMVLAGRFEVFEDGTVEKIKGGVHSPANLYYIGRDKKYAAVNFYDGERQIHAYVHRLIATAFIPNPQNLPQVNHKDGNPRNNSISNLEWVTASQNIQHAYDIGLINPMATAVPCEYCGAFTKSKTGICMKCKKSLLDEAKKIDRSAEISDRFSAIDTSTLAPVQAEYVKCRALGMGVSEIAEKFEVSRQCVSASLLKSEAESRKPRKMSKTQQNMLVALQIKENKALSKLNNFKTDVKLAQNAYAAAKAAREIFQSSCVDPVGQFEEQAQKGGNYGTEYF